ncbi:putative membrane protein [Amorphus suaedae]
MSQNIRKLIGTTVMAIFVVVYALFAMLMGATFVSSASTLVQTIFYGIAGLVWVIPAGLLIRWMARPDPDVQ